MFWCEAIDEFASLLERTRDENCAGNFGGEVPHAERQFSELPFDFALHFAGEGGGSGDEETGGVFCVFGLGQQVGGDPARVAFGRQDNRFGWPSGQINRAIAADDLFGGRDVFVPRAEDFFNVGNRLCAVSEGGDRLCTADSGDLPGAQEACGCEQLGIRPGTDSDDTRNASDFGWDGRHDQR